MSKRRTGIEPASSPWKGEALPLSYRRAREAAPAGGAASGTVCTNGVALGVRRHAKSAAAWRCAQRPRLRSGFVSPSTNIARMRARRSGRAVVADVRRIEVLHGEWRSLVAHPAGGRAVAGSNPVSPIRLLMDADGGGRGPKARGLALGSGVLGEAGACDGLRAARRCRPGPPTKPPTRASVGGRRCFFAWWPRTEPRQSQVILPGTILQC
jgi:hypothetical protein